MAKIYLRLAVETEERSDRWVCHSPQLAFTVYGKTRSAAENEVNHALNALIGSFRQDTDAIKQYLESRQVEYRIQDGDAPAPAETPFADGLMQYDVALGQPAGSASVRSEEVLIA